MAEELEVKQEKEEYVSPWAGSNKEVDLGEQSFGSKALEFGLDTAEVAGIGSLTLGHGIANLAEGAVNVLASPTNTRPEVQAPLETQGDQPVFNYIDNDIQKAFPILEDMSDEKMILGHLAGMLVPAVGTTNALSKVSSIKNLLTNGSLTTRLATRVATGMAGDITASLVTPDKRAGNLFDLISPEEDDMFNIMATGDLEDGSMKVALKNLGAELVAGGVGQVLVDGLVGAYKVVGKSDVAKAHRVKLMADLLDDENLAMTKRWVQDRVDGFSIMADKTLNRPNVTTSIKPIASKEFDLMGDTYDTLKAKELRAVGNIDLRLSKDIKKVDIEEANKLKRLEADKEADLKVLARDRELLDEELIRRQKQLQGDAPKADQGKASAKKSRSRYNQQVRNLEDYAQKQSDLLDARELSITQQAEASHKVIGETTEASREAIKRTADNDIAKVTQTSDRYKKYIDEADVAKKQVDEIDVENTIKESTHEAVDTAVASTVRDGVDESVADLDKAEKVRRVKIDKEKRKAIQQGVEQRVTELEASMAKGSFTDEEAELVDKFITNYKNGNVVVNDKGEVTNVLRTGKQATEDVSNILSFFGKELNTVKKVINAEANVKYINQVLNHGVTDEFTKALDNLTKYKGLDRETLLLNMNSWGVVVQESAHVVTAIHKHLDDAIGEAHAHISKLDKRMNKLPKKERILTAEDVEGIVQSNNTIQALYEGLGGISSGHGRGLRASGSGYGSHDIGQALEGARRNLNLKKPSVVAGKANRVKKNLLDDMMRNLDVKDQKQLQKFINEMASMSKEEFGSKLMTKTPDVEMFNDIVRVHGLLSMIAAPATLGRVWIGSFLQIGFDQLITKNIESILATAGRSLGVTKGGARFDNIARAKAMLRVMKDYMKYWNGDPTALGSIGRTATDYADRSLHATPKAIYDNIHKAIDVRVGKDFTKIPYVSRAVTRVERIVSAPLALSMYLAGRPVRGMEMGDALYRRLAIEAEMTTSAISMYNNKGGKAFFGDAIDEKTFTDRYMAKGRAYSDLTDELADKKISQLQFTDKVTELFKGDAKLLDDVTEAHDWAVQRGLRNTQQEDTSDTVLGTMIRGMNQATKGNETGAVFGRFVSTMLIPFQKSPVNSLRTAVEMSPLCVTSGRFRKQLMEGSTHEKINAMSKVIAGTTLMYGLSQLVAEGALTGSVPRGGYKDYETKQWQPHSLKIGNTYYSYKGSPFEVLLATTADVIRHGASKDKDSEKLSALTFGLFMNVATDASAYQGLTDTIEALRSDDPNKMLQMVAGKIDPFVSFGRGVAKPLADFQSDAKMESTLAKEQESILGSMNRIIANTTRNSFIGILLKTDTMDSVFDTYDRKLDVMGQPIKKYGDSLMNALLSTGGLRNVSMDSDWVRSELVNIGALSNANSPTAILGVSIDSQMDKNLRDNMWNGSAGRLGLMTKLRNFMDTPHYQDGSLHQRKSWVTNMINAEKDWYKTNIYNTNEELRHKVKQTANDKIRAGSTKGTTKNVKPEDRMTFASTEDTETKQKLQKQGQKVLKALGK